jgi:prefoldin subunit 5
MNKYLVLVAMESNMSISTDKEISTHKIDTEHEITDAEQMLYDRIEILSDEITELNDNLAQVTEERDSAEEKIEELTAINR